MTHKHKIPPTVARAITMVREGHDDTGPNPGYQSRILQDRLKTLTEGFKELEGKEGFRPLVDAVQAEIQEIATALSQFKVGDRVDFINDYGAIFPDKVITGIEVFDGEIRYHITPTDCPWYPKRARNLFLRTEDPGEENRENINIRYFLYAKTNGRTPEEMIEFDRGRYPGGCMCGFILWIDSKWREWEKATGNFPPHSIADHTAFDAWLITNL